MTMWGKLLEFPNQGNPNRTKKKHFAPLAEASDFIAHNRRITEILESFDRWVLAKET